MTEFLSQADKVAVLLAVDAAFEAGEIPEDRYRIALKTLIQAAEGHSEAKLAMAVMVGNRETVDVLGPVETAGKTWLKKIAKAGDAVDCAMSPAEIRSIRKIVKRVTFVRQKFRTPGSGGKKFDNRALVYWLAEAYEAINDKRATGWKGFSEAKFLKFAKRWNKRLFHAHLPDDREIDRILVERAKQKASIPEKESEAP